MENNELFINSIENAIHSFIMCVKDEHKNTVITQERIYNEIVSRVELDNDNECNQKEIVCDIINQIFNNKNEITMLELVSNFIGEQCNNEDNNVNNDMKQYTSGNGSAHKVNISELNLLDQDIPKELIHVHKPFENDDTTNNGRVLNNNYNKYDNVVDIEYETLIKPSNNFGSLYCDNDNDNTNMQAELDVNDNDDDNSNNNEQCYNDEPIVYPINKKKNTFLYLSNDDVNAPQSLNQSRDNERKYRREGDFFMNLYQSVSYNNKKKLHLINDKINKLYNSTYDTNNNNTHKQPYYAMSLKHMGKTTTQHNNNHLYLNTPLTSILQYKKTKTHNHHQYKKKLSFERDKLFNEVLTNAKRESAFISQRNINNTNNNKHSNNLYNLNEIEEQIVDLIARNRKVNANINERSIEIKIAEQLKSMTDNTSDRPYNDNDNYVIDEHINILNINNNQQ
jgi:hypothetical protein